MPRYDFRCRECSATFEVDRPMAAAGDPALCPAGHADTVKLLSTVAFTGLTMPLCCENIFVPVIARPNNPAEIDALALRARTFLEWVIRGIQV